MKLESSNSIIKRKSRSNIRSTVIMNAIAEKIEKIENIEKINLEDFEIKEKIGKDSFGTFRICKNKSSDKVYEMKIIKKSDNLVSKSVEHISNEYQIFSTIFHPFIIDLKGICSKDPYTLNFLFEFIPGGNLETLIRSNKRLPTDQARFYLASLITVLDYLHKKNIVHRDIKPDNILINSNGYIKIGNLCYSKIMTTSTTYTLCGTPEYCSPEMINKSGHNKSVDFWGLGVVLYEMLTGFTPFIDPDPMKIYSKINNGKVDFPRNIDKKAKSMIKHFLTVDIQKRLGCGQKGFMEIIEDEFLENFDWKGLLYRSLKPPYIPVVNGPMDTSNYGKMEDTYEDEMDTPINQDKDPFYNW